MNYKYLTVGILLLVTIIVGFVLSDYAKHKREQQKELALKDSSGSRYDSIPSGYGHDSGTSFKDGDTIYPDYAVPDTLLVTNADMLNRLIPHCETDGEICEVMYLGCDVIPDSKYAHSGDYQFVMNDDSVWIWDRRRFVGKYVTNWKNQIDTILLKDKKNQ